MLYADTRNEDNIATEFPTLICDNVELYDIVRFFHGDGPACQLEAGQQKGGDYPCWSCPVNIKRSSDIVHSYYLPTLGIKERIEKVIESKNSQIKLKTNEVHMFSELRKKEIMIELRQRNVSFSEESNREVLKSKLKHEMHGGQRLPALFL